nr:hypothetical protein [Tanacetum cinerariifolium]
MIKVLPPKTAKEVVAREKERKAKTTLLMALPEDHLAKFHKIEGLHRWYDRFQTLLSQLEIHGTTASSSNIHNMTFVSAKNTSNTNDVTTAYSVSSLSNSKSQKEGSSSYTDEVIYSVFSNQSSAPQLDYNDLEQINNDDIEEMDLKWQDDSKALVTINGEDINWSGHVTKDAQSYAMMAYSSNNSGSDNEVKSCSKACEESYAILKKLYNDQRDKLGDTSVEITAYTLALKKVEAQLLCNQQNQLAYEQKISVETSTSMPEPVENPSKVVYEPKVWTDAPIIEEYESDSDNDLMSNVQEDKEKPNFAFTDSIKHVKTSWENIKETGTTNQSPKIKKQDRNSYTRKGLGYAFTRKACFVCGSFSHLIRDCDFHEKRMAKQATLTKSKNKDDPHRALKDKGIVDSRCSRHMTGNKAHLADY